MQCIKMYYSYLNKYYIIYFFIIGFKKWYMIVDIATQMIMFTFIILEDSFIQSDS